MEAVVVAGEEGLGEGFGGGVGVGLVIAAKAGEFEGWSNKAGSYFRDLLEFVRGWATIFHAELDKLKTAIAQFR